MLFFYTPHTCMFILIFANDYLKLEMAQSYTIATKSPRSRICDKNFESNKICCKIHVPYNERTADCSAVQ